MNYKQHYRMLSCRLQVLCYVHVVNHITMNRFTWNIHSYYYYYSLAQKPCRQTPRCICPNRNKLGFYAETQHVLGQWILSVHIALPNISMYTVQQRIKILSERCDDTRRVNVGVYTYCNQLPGWRAHSLTLTVLGKQTLFFHMSTLFPLLCNEY